MDEQFAKLKTLLAAGKFRPEKAEYERWVFQRGWNAGVEFAEQQIAKLEKVKPSEAQQ